MVIKGGCRAKEICDFFNDEVNFIVNQAELKKNDYNISPSRYIHTSDAETYRPIPEVVAGLDEIETLAKKTDDEFGEILNKIGFHDGNFTYI